MKDAEITKKTCKEEITERRGKVAEQMKFKTEVEMAADLNCSVVTIARDVAFLKQAAQHWLDDLAANGFIFEYKIALDELKENRNKLKNLYSNTTENFEKRLIVKDLDSNIALYIKLLSEAPTVLALRRKTGGMKHV